MKTEFKFDNGQKVKDVVSGLTGIISGACVWLNGCIQYSVQPRMITGEATKPDGWWIDEAQLVSVRGGIVDKVKTKDTGGPSTRSPQ